MVKTVNSIEYRISNDIVWLIAMIAKFIKFFRVNVIDLPGNHIFRKQWFIAILFILISEFQLTATFRRDAAARQGHRHHDSRMGRFTISNYALHWSKGGTTKSRCTSGFTWGFFEKPEVFAEEKKTGGSRRVGLAGGSSPGKGFFFCLLFYWMNETLSVTKMTQNE